MTFSSKLALVAATVAIATPVAAQRIPVGGSSTNTKPTENSRDQVTDRVETKETAATLSTGRKLELSKDAQAALVELQTAVRAKDTANIPAKLAAAQAVMKTPDDKYVVAVNQTQAALDANDLAGIQAGIDAMQASGVADNGDIATRYANLGKRYLDAKQAAPAATALQKALGLDPNNVNALKMLAVNQNAQGQKAQAVATMQKAFAATKASGGKVLENDYKFAAGLAHDAKLPAAYQIARLWVADYPSPTSWHSSLRIHRDVASPTGDALLDNMRLAHATNALTSESEYFSFANALIEQGRLAEAKVVLDAGAANQAYDPSKSAFTQLRTKVAKAPTRAAVDASAKASLAAGTGRGALDAGDAYYGVGAYAEAAAAYRAAIGKSGVDANLANLRLGMALARAGDKPGAAAALNAVAGAHAETAKFWLVYAGAPV